jgi:hypothetical protein
MFVERCHLGTGKWLLWRGGYYQNHFIKRNQLIGEYDTEDEARDELARLTQEATA